MWLLCLVIACQTIVPPVKLAGPERYATTKVRVTAYSATDSCHYPVAGGCLTASGTIATPYRSAACPRDVPYGSTFAQEGHEWVCEDRTAEWVQNDLGRTFDLFVGYGAEAHEQAVKHGVKPGMIDL